QFVSDVAAIANPIRTVVANAPKLVDPLLTQLKGAQLLAAELNALGPAVTLDMPAGELQTEISASGFAEFQPPADAASNDSAEPVLSAQAYPTALVFQGPDNSDNTLSLNFQDLPRLADGTSAIKTIVYHGGSGGFNTLKVEGGRFQKEAYYATGPD